MLSFEDNAVRKGHTRYFNPKVEVKDYNFMMNETNFFDQPVKTDIETYNKSQKKKKKYHDSTINCLLDYPCFKEHYKMIPIDLNKQQAINADRKARQQIDFTANIDWAGETFIFSFMN